LPPWPRARLIVVIRLSTLRLSTRERRFRRTMTWLINQYRGSRHLFGRGNCQLPAVLSLHAMSANEPPVSRSRLSRIICWYKSELFRHDLPKTGFQELLRSGYGLAAHRGAIVYPFRQRVRWLGILYIRGGIQDRNVERRNLIP